MNAADDYPKVLWTIWRFESPLSGEVAVVVRRADPRDLAYQSPYQRVLGQVFSRSREGAMERFRENEGGAG